MGNVPQNAQLKYVTMQSVQLGMLQNKGPDDAAALTRQET